MNLKFYCFIIIMGVGERVMFVFIGWKFMWLLIGNDNL